MLTAGLLAPPADIDSYQLDRLNPPSRRQLAEAGVDIEALTTLRMGDLAAVLTERPPDVLILALPGGGTIAARHALAARWSSDLRRPLLVTGYVGVVYEKLVEGALARAGSDIVLANSGHDAARFRRLYRDLGLDPDPVVEAGLPFLRGPEAPRAGRRFTVTFAGQPGVPAGEADRTYLVDRLIRHARLHPERVVNIKLRSMPGERVTHAEPYPYPAILRRAPGPLPENIRITLGDMGEALRATDLLVTVSSTAALEAMNASVPTVLLTDFGVREQLGNAHFAGSGCLASFDEVDAGIAPLVDPDWAAEHGVDPLGPEQFVARVSALLAAEPPPLRPYYTMARSPAYLSRLLASYGLGPDGRPATAWNGSTVRLARRALRSTARTLYRTGTHVVAPALRKLASL